MRLFVLGKFVGGLLQFRFRTVPSGKRLHPSLEKTRISEAAAGQQDSIRNSMRTSRSRDRLTTSPEKEWLEMTAALMYKRFAIKV